MSDERALCVSVAEVDALTAALLEIGAEVRFGQVTLPLHPSRRLVDALHRAGHRIEVGGHAEHD